MSSIRLKPGRERSVLRKHPWLFSGAVAEVEGDPRPGDTVDITSANGEWLARGAYSPHSQIRARIWTWDREDLVDDDFLMRRLARAIQARERLEQSSSITGYREVHAESDGVPGLIVDRYDRYRVIQFLTAGAERWRDSIVDGLSQRRDCDGIYERSDVEIRRLEGLTERTGVVLGKDPPHELVIVENGLRYKVDVYGGQKTGFYLDQRDNRETLRHILAGGEVLDCFAYTGAFTVAALSAGAERVVSIEASSPALEQARENVALNDLPGERCEWIEGDVFEELRRLRDRGSSFDGIVLDPPRFAATSSHIQRAARGYKDINLLAFKMLRPGGLLFTFSCSGGVSPELFQGIVAGAALDAGVDANIVAWLGQPHDHPVALNFPEGRYLKGLVCRVGR